MTSHWRRMTASDIDAILPIAEACFPHHAEDRECFFERLSLSPDWCYVLVESGGDLNGYLIAFAWPLNSVPRLNGKIRSLPSNCEALFVNDLALLPQARGQGHAGRAMQRLVRHAPTAGLRMIALVAVNESEAFWAYQGFTSQQPDPQLARKLNSYGPEARYMVRPIANDMI